MLKLSILSINNKFLDLGFSLLSDDVMLNIRGGAEKPKSRPREFMDWETQTASTLQNTEDPSLADYIKEWLKSWKK